MPRHLLGLEFIPRQRRRVRTRHHLPLSLRSPHPLAFFSRRIVTSAADSPMPFEGVEFGAGQVEQLTGLKHLGLPSTLNPTTLSRHCAVLARHLTVRILLARR